MISFLVPSPYYLYIFFLFLYMSWNYSVLSTHFENNLNCKKGIPIGIMEDATYENNTLSMEDYAMVCMYTDGILE
ncbi:SpoIIE family protein phosphatase, partial [Clostridioides difficile]